MATSILNNPNCTSDVGNTGLSQCPIELGLVIGGALVPQSFNVPAASMVSLTAFKAYLQAATIANVNERIFPLPVFHEVTDQSTEPKEETLAFGAVQTIMEGKRVTLFRFLSGGLDIVAQLRKFNGKNYKLIYWTNKQVIGTSDGEGGMLGFATYQLYTAPVKLADGTKGNIYTIKIGEENVAEWDNYAVVDCSVGTGNFNPSTAILGILDVTLANEGAYTTEIDLSVVTRADKIDLTNTYDTEFADPTVWIVKDSLGVEQTIDTVEVDTENKIVKLVGTFPAATYTVTMIATAALAAKNIGGPPVSGYEANTISVTTVAS